MMPAELDFRMLGNRQGDDEMIRWCNFEAGGKRQTRNGTAAAMRGLTEKIGSTFRHLPDLLLMQRQNRSWV